MVEKERDWDKEMAEVDRLLKKLPNADPTLGRGGSGGGGGGGAEPTLRRPAVTPAYATPSGGMYALGGRLGTWVKVALGVLIGIGVAPGVWPYSHGCGLRVIFYLLGVTTVVAAGVWASMSSWRRRLGFAHVIAQVLIVWGILLMTREVLPRVGAKPVAPWLCPDIPQPR
ncbi:MAG TPA: hypothetical protein VGV12_03225 [Gemmatimonadales bacterium]|nr:hypothetical protein [Gemmatimonadales bacterium]